MIRLIAATSLFAFAACAQAEAPAPSPDDSGTPAAAADTTDATAMTTVYDVTLTSLTNQPLPLDQYRGHPILLVNTASKCGFTPQYEGLQALWTEYEGQGLVVLGVPSDNFGGQEFQDSEDIAEFCKLNFGVTFPLAQRDDVIGESRNVLYTMAEDALGEAAIPKWNFHKILISADGVPVAAFGSNTTPEDPALIAAIEAQL